MSTRHKKIKILDKEYLISSIVSRKNIPYALQRIEILNAGKINHKIHGTFNVKENNGNLSVKCHILDDIQFAGFAEFLHMTHHSLFVDESKTTMNNPPDSLYSSGLAQTEGKFEFDLDKENVLYFILDNSFSKLKAKQVQLIIWEEWDESMLPLDVVTTTPPQDTSIDETTQHMITSAKKRLKILSPYVDMYLIKKLLEQKEKGVEVHIVTRDVLEVKKQKGNVQALQYLQESFGGNHRVNPFVHSRMIIKDDLDALVSSADLTRDSLLSQYNAGLILSDPILLQKLLSYFKQIFTDSKEMSKI